MSSTTPWNRGCQSGSRVEDEKKIADGAEGKRAEYGPDRAALTAEQRHPAEHDSSNRKERVGVAAGEGRFARIGEEGEEQSADRGEQAGQRIGQEFGAPDRHRPTYRLRARTSPKHRRRDHRRTG